MAEATWGALELCMGHEWTSRGGDIHLDVSYAGPGQIDVVMTNAGRLMAHVQGPTPWVFASLIQRMEKESA